MKFGIIGYGNLGKALVRGKLCTGVCQEDIVINTRTEKTRKAVRESFEYIKIAENKKSYSKR